MCYYCHTTRVGWSRSLSVTLESVTSEAVTFKAVSKIYVQKRTWLKTELRTTRHITPSKCLRRTLDLHRRMTPFRTSRHYYILLDTVRYWVSKASIWSSTCSNTSSRVHLACEYCVKTDVNGCFRSKSHGQVHFCWVLWPVSRPKPPQTAPSRINPHLYRIFRQLQTRLCKSTLKKKKSHQPNRKNRNSKKLHARLGCRYDTLLCNNIDGWTARHHLVCWITLLRAPTSPWFPQAAQAAMYC